MKLTATVSRVDSANGYDDKRQRVFLKVAQAEGDMYNEIKLPNVENKLSLDDELVLLVLTKDETELLRTVLMLSRPTAHRARSFQDTIADQLRPDAPDAVEVADA